MTTVAIGAATPAGDGREAKRLVAGLYDEFGFDAADVGGLDESR